ncbi:MAG: hypothetical protein AB7V47_06935 [Phycisphaerales bacterium]
MKIVHDDGRVLRLYGVVLGLPWVLVLVTICGTGWVVLPMVAFNAISRGPWWLSIGPLVGIGVIGLLTGAGFMAALQRESLELDKATGEGVFRTWYRVIGREERKAFELARVDSVSVEYSQESRGGGRGFPVNVCRARLRLVSPRRAFTLDEVRDSNVQRVCNLAERVGAFLGVTVVQEGSPDDEQP